jgi:hypothetical protein
VSNCDQYIIQVYTDKRINEYLSRLQPSHLHDDLRQELSMILLEYDCDKIIEIANNDKLSNFAMKILWNLSTQTKNNFYNLFRKHIFELDFDVIDELPEETNIECLSEIFNQKKYQSVNDLHEFYIFEKYIELRKQSEVARYFDVPKMHVNAVINKVKDELKEKLKSCI